MLVSYRIQDKRCGNKEYKYEYKYCDLCDLCRFLLVWLGCGYGYMRYGYRYEC